MGGWAERSPHQLKELCLVRMRAVMAATMSPATCALCSFPWTKIGHCVSLTNHRRLALSPSRSAAVEVLRLVDRVAVWATHLGGHRLGAGTETRDVGAPAVQGLARRADAPDTHAAHHLGAPLAPEAAHVIMVGIQMPSSPAARRPPRPRSDASPVLPYLCKYGQRPTSSCIRTASRSVAARRSRAAIRG